MERVCMTWEMDRLFKSVDDRKIVVRRGEGEIAVEDALYEEGAAECSGEVGNDIKELNGETRERPSDNLRKRSQVAQVVCAVLDQQGVAVVPSSRVVLRHYIRSRFP